MRECLSVRSSNYLCLKKLVFSDNKVGGKCRYKRMIPLAEAIFEQHLPTLEKE